MDECLLNDGIHRKAVRPGTTSIHSAEIYTITYIAFMFVCMFEKGETLFEHIRLGFVISLLILNFSSLIGSFTSRVFTLPYFGAHVSYFCENFMQNCVFSVHPYCWHLDVLDSSI